MSKKIIVIGGVAGGASVAARARRLDESAQITMYEKGPECLIFKLCAALSPIWHDSGRGKYRFDGF